MNTSNLVQSITQYLQRKTRCIICQHSKQSHSMLICDYCLSFFKQLQNVCQRCALPLSAQHTNYCGQCITKITHWDQARVAYWFDEPLRTLIHEFKYQKKLYWRTLLGQLMLHAFDPVRFAAADGLVPVPLHDTRLCHRGYNQSAELAKYLARRTGIQYCNHICQRSKQTQPQVELKTTQRQDNLKDAFQASYITQSYLIIIDDVMTTGATINELARTLKANGAKRVDVWCLARALGI